MLKRKLACIKNWIKIRVPLWSWIVFLFALISLGIYIGAVINYRFADFINENIASYFRMILAKITGLLPFSLAEIIIYLLPLIIVFIIVMVVRYTKKCEDIKLARFFVASFAILSLFFSTFVFTHGTGYRGSTLDVRLGIEKNKVSKEQLVFTAKYLLKRLNETSKDVEFEKESFSVMPYSFSEMNEKLNKAYSKVCNEYDFILDYNSKVKPVIASKALSYAHILGVYTYYTGESNVNIDFPDYNTPYTAAHEMSHQRGISREDEANFMAYLVCISSDDAYIRYSGYLNMFEYVMNALYSTDKESYREIYLQQNIEIQYELIAYRDFYQQYEENVVADVSGTVNDKYLQFQGQSAGVKSYGLVVDLMVAYAEKDSNFKS